MRPWWHKDVVVAGARPPPPHQPRWVQRLHILQVRLRHEVAAHHKAPAVEASLQQHVTDPLRLQPGVVHLHHSLVGHGVLNLPSQGAQLAHLLGLLQELCLSDSTAAAVTMAATCRHRPPVITPWRPVAVQHVQQLIAPTPGQSPAPSTLQLDLNGLSGVAPTPCSRSRPARPAAASDAKDKALTSPCCKLPHSRRSAGTAVTTQRNGQVQKVAKQGAEAHERNGDVTAAPGRGEEHSTS